MTDSIASCLPSTPLTSEDFAAFAKSLDKASVLRHIQHCHEQALLSFGHGLQWGFNCGLFLIWMKDHVLEHGQYVPWVQEYCPFDIRQAQRYTRLVRKWDEIFSKATSEDAFPTNSVAGLLEYVKEETPPAADDTPVNPPQAGMPAAVEPDEAATESDSDSGEVQGDAASNESGPAAAAKQPAESPPPTSPPNGKPKQKPKKKMTMPASPEKTGRQPTEFKPGDKFYTVDHDPFHFPPIVELVCYKVEDVRDKTYLATNGERIDKSVALTLEVAKSRHAGFIEQLLPELAKVLTRFKARLEKPRIEHRYEERRRPHDEETCP